MRYKDLTRVLALDLHPRRFGYVVVESPDRLLDWGVRSHRHKRGSTIELIRRLRSLLELWSPSVLVIRGSRQTRSRKGVGRGRLFRRMLAQARNRHVGVRILKQRATDLAETLPKYERAATAATRFPVLAQRLPPKRKPWESEHYSMSMFEALGLVYRRG
jgi:hypothetical protein